MSVVEISSGRVGGRGGGDGVRSEFCDRITFYLKSGAFDKLVPSGYINSNDIYTGTRHLTLVWTVTYLEVNEGVNNIRVWGIEIPQGVQGQSPIREPGGEVPQGRG